ncbi:MAG: universal stress protein, partial [Mycobacteriales bacterium]
MAHAYSYAGSPGSPDATARRWQADQIVEAGVEAAYSTAPGIDATSYAAEGDVRTVLLEAAQQPTLVVVGSRGRGSTAALLLGSTGIDLAGHASCPVAIIRQPEPEGGGLFAGAVVVGIAGAEASSVTVGFAFAEAACRGVPLVAVHVGAFSSIDAWRDETFDELHEERDDGGWALLEVAVEPFRVTYPGVRVKLALRYAVPAVSGLLAAAEGAALL